MLTAEEAGLEAVLALREFTAALGDAVAAASVRRVAERLGASPASVDRWRRAHPAQALDDVFAGLIG